MSDMVRGGYRELNYSDYHLLEIMQIDMKTKCVRNEIRLNLI